MAPQCSTSLSPLSFCSGTPNSATFEKFWSFFRPPELVFSGVNFVEKKNRTESLMKNHTDATVEIHT